MASKSKENENLLDPNNFVIDEHNLEKEWVKQPQLIYQLSNEIATIQYKIDSLKLKMVIHESELSVDIRANPEKYGLDKVTEKAIENIITNDEKRKKMEATLIEYQLNLSMLKGAYTALEHKKKALENLVHLLTIDYFAQPTVKTDNEILNELKKQNRSRLARNVD